jgi:hypothetical protein
VYGGSALTSYLRAPQAQDPLTTIVWTAIDGDGMRWRMCYIKLGMCRKMFDFYR